MRGFNGGTTGLFVSEEKEVEGLQQIDPEVLQL